MIDIVCVGNLDQKLQSAGCAALMAVGHSCTQTYLTSITMMCTLPVRHGFEYWCMDVINLVGHHMLTGDL